MLKERVLVLLTYITVAFIAYRNCFDIFIPGDNYSLLYVFKTDGLSGAIHTLCAYLFSLPATFLLYKLFSDSSAGWVTVSVLLHALNAFLTYRFASKSLGTLFGATMSRAAIFAGLIFLLSPYQTEAILWSPTNLPFLLSLSLTLCCLLIFLNHLESKQKKLPYLFYIVFLLDVFSYESCFVLPAISFLIFMLYAAMNKTTQSVREFTIRCLAPQAGIMFLFFAASKIIYGVWMWHGAEFGMSLTFSTLGGNALKYLAKFFLFFRYLPLGSGDSMLREIYSQQAYVLMMIAFCTLLLFLCFFILARKKKGEGYFIGIMFLCFLVSLVPVLPLDSSFLKDVYPDRYGYLPSVFFYIFLSCFVFFFVKKFALPLLALYVALCSLLLSQTLTAWNTVNEYCYTLTRSYEPLLKYDRVYVLNVPTYFQGLAAFRSAFPETIALKNNLPAEKICVVAGCYQDAITDTLTSVMIEGNTVTVTAAQKITPYFSTHGGWATSYETGEYKVIFSPDGCSYTLSFKQEIPTNAAFIYTSGGTWKKAG